jgi:hypothetical protein
MLDLQAKLTKAHLQRLGTNDEDLQLRMVSIQTEDVHLMKMKVLPNQPALHFPTSSKMA